MHNTLQKKKKVETGFLSFSISKIKPFVRFKKVGPLLFNNMFFCFLKRITCIRSVSNMLFKQAIYSGPAETICHHCIAVGRLIFWPWPVIKTLLASVVPQEVYIQLLKQHSSLYCNILAARFISLYLNHLKWDSWAILVYQHTLLSL